MTTISHLGQAYQTCIGVKLVNRSNDWSKEKSKKTKEETNDS